MKPQMADGYRSSLQVFGTVAFERVIMEGLIGIGAVRIKADNHIDIDPSLALGTICLDLWLEVVPFTYVADIVELLRPLRARHEDVERLDRTSIVMFVAEARALIFSSVVPR